MSMVDETPDLFIRNGKLYRHHSGSSYTSCGFTEYDPDQIDEICEANDDGIAAYLEEKKHIYDTNKHKYLDWPDIKIVAYDAFGNNVYVGSRIILMDMYYDDSFRKFVLGTIIGDTPEYVKIKPDDPELSKRGVYRLIDGKYRYVQYNTGYILRSKHSKRFILIRKIK